MDDVILAYPHQLEEILVEGQFGFDCFDLKSIKIKVQ